MVRDEIDLGLPTPRGSAPGSGRGRWQQFLLDLIDGRMEPTDWLNDNFVDPLFLSEAEAETRRQKQVELIGHDGGTSMDEPGTAATGTELALSSDALANVAGAEGNFAVALAGAVCSRRTRSASPTTGARPSGNFPNFS